MEDLSLHDIIAIFKRRRSVFYTVAGVIFVIGFVYSVRYSHYRATATVQIEQPIISNSVTNVTATNNEPADNSASLADRRVAQIQQRVLSISSLSKVIAKLNLYPGLNNTMSADKLTDIMRSKVKLDFVSSTVSNPTAAAKESVDQLSAIAFTLSFDYNDPKMAKEALDELVARFIAEEADQRRTQAKDTSAFLDEQLKALAAQIKDQEKEVADFKAKFGESGPTALLYTQQASTTTNMNLQNVEGQISANEQTQGALRGQLATADPYLPILEENGRTISSPQGQMKSLQAQLAQMQGKYGPDHPDVLKVHDQIMALKSQGTRSASPGAIKRDADNPAYLQISAQLSAAEAQHQSLMAQRDALLKQQDKYDHAIAENPQVEQQMSQLSLDLDNAKLRYRDLKDKKMAAQMRETLAGQQNAQLLTVINPPRVPEGTTPSRKLLLLASTFLALMGGMGAVVLIEMLSQSVRGANHLASIIGAAPLVTIPHISKAHHG